MIFFNVYYSIERPTFWKVLHVDTVFAENKSYRVVENSVCEGFVYVLPYQFPFFFFLSFEEIETVQKQDIL